MPWKNLHQNPAFYEANSHYIDVAGIKQHCILVSLQITNYFENN